MVWQVCERHQVLVTFTLNWDREGQHSVAVTLPEERIQPFESHDQVRIIIFPVRQIEPVDGKTNIWDNWVIPVLPKGEI